jgi:membrane-associated protein
MEIFADIYSFLIHIDTHFGEIIIRYGTASYAILFAIVFAETGLVFTPFLPGDSLLFVAGAFSALGSFNIVVLLICFGVPLYWVIQSITG